MNKKMKKDVKLSPSAIIAVGFLLLILTATLLLMLPISARNRQSTPLLTSLFTATSAVCVTGQALVDTGTHWSLFGQVVLIVAIQIGGLGVMTLMALVSMALGKRIGLRQRTLLQESVASFQVGGIVRLVRFAMRGTAVVEGCGAVLLSFRFVPMLGWAKGIWYSVFHSISAFCNAGFDLMGPISGEFTSLESFVGDPFVNGVVIMLILLGGLGFFVWEDLFKNRLHWKKLRLHTRVALTLAAVLAHPRAAGAAGKQPRSLLLEKRRHKRHALAAQHRFGQTRIAERAAQRRFPDGQTRRRLPAHARAFAQQQEHRRFNRRQPPQRVQIVRHRVGQAVRQNIHPRAKQRRRAFFKQHRFQRFARKTAAPVRRRVQPRVVNAAVGRRQRRFGRVVPRAFAAQRNQRRNRPVFERVAQGRHAFQIEQKPAKLSDIHSVPRFGTA